MTHPQEGAKYKHKPKWLDEEKLKESKVNTPYKQSDWSPDKVSPAVIGVNQGDGIEGE
jgi:hypothetical protein